MSDITNYCNHLISIVRVLADKLTNLNKESLYSLNQNICRYPYDKKYNIISQMSSSITQINSQIYLGSSYNAANYAELKLLGITTIINVSTEISNYFKNYFNYINIHIDDILTDSIIPYFHEIYDYIIEHPDEIILIHCYAGRSRSACIVLYYLIRYYNLSLIEGIALLQNKRNIISINIKFLSELQHILLEESYISDTDYGFFDEITKKNNNCIDDYIIIDIN
jgi:hypothetical protein